MSIPLSIEKFWTLTVEGVGYKELLRKIKSMDAYESFETTVSTSKEIDWKIFENNME